MGESVGATMMWLAILQVLAGIAFFAVVGWMLTRRKPPHAGSRRQRDPDKDEKKS